MICYIQYNISTGFMHQKRLQSIENQIARIKVKLQSIGPMRPGSLSTQYKIPKDKIGPTRQLSYTHKMKGHTEYVRTQFVAETKKQIATYKRFRKLMETWVSLAIEHAKLTIEQAKIK